MTDPIRAVGFDLDDTLFDHVGASETALRAFVSERGVAPTDALRETWSRLETVHFERWRQGLVGFQDQRRDRLAAFLPLLGRSVDRRHERTLDEIFESYLAHYRAAWRPVKGALEILTDLQDRGLTIGILTNGQLAQQREKLTATGIGALVDVVLTPEQTGHAKPDARAFAALAAAFGRQPSEIAFVGDNPDHDVRGARDAGFVAAAVGVGPAGPTLAEAVSALLE